MPDVAPLGCTHQSPLRFSVPPSVPHGGWATCGGRSPGSRLERPFPTFPVTQREPPVAYAEETCRLQLREQPRSWRRAPHRVPIFIGCAHSVHNRNRRAFRAPERRHDVNAKAAAPSAMGASGTVLQHPGDPPAFAQLAAARPASRAPPWIKRLPSSTRIPINYRQPDGAL